MAITFVGSNTQDSAGALSLTFTIPAGATTDDFMVAFVKQSENTGQQTWDDDGGGGNGWTRLAYNRTTGGRDQETAVYWKIHDGSESNPTFTWNTSGTTEPMSGSLLVYRGTDTTDPIQDWGFIEAQNDSSPPNAGVNIGNDPATIIVCHNATHDDITTPTSPTGYTSRTTIHAGTANDHRNQFTADLIGRNGIGAYTPPDWAHTTLNNTPEYHCYTLALQEPVVTAITDVNTDEKIAVDEVNNVITGFGFEATQGTGKVELWSDATGTTKVTQTIDSWGDTSIQFDAVDTGLSEGTLYLVVTNDSGDETAPFAITYGLPAYKSLIEALSPDHYWSFDNTYDDDGITGPVRNATSGVVGTQIFVSTPIAEDSTHAWELNSVTDRREIADSPNMNITISSKERTICTWVQLNKIQQSLGAIWKEGGGVQNLAFLVGLGNVLMAQLADVAGSRDNVQAISDFRLTPSRPYHILMRYSHLDTVKEFNLYIDGRKQAVTDGNPMTLGIFDSHSGDVTWGDPDNNLETGGTDIAYAGQEDCYLSHFITWSDNSAGTNAGGLSDSEILELFQRGAIPDDTISSGTESAMQTSLDGTADARPDWPLSYRIESPTGGGDLELTLTDKIFDSGITEHVEWRGTGTLTLVRAGTTNLDSSKTFAPNGGTISVEDDVDVTVTVVDINTNAVIEDARVRMTADTGGPLTSGTVILTGLTNASGQITGTLRYSSDQPVDGRVRQGTTSTFYKTQPISATITNEGLDLTVFMTKDE